MIDGAGGLTLYTKVILPLLRPTIIVVLLMSLVNSFKVFDSIWVMTKGGPYRTSETLALTMYQESFIYNRLGSDRDYSDHSYFDHFLFQYQRNI